MRKNLKIDLDDLIFAIQCRDSWYDRYLDLETGKIIIERGQAFDPGNTGRYLLVESFPSNDGLRLMEEFIEGIENSKMRGNLLKAISGSKPFRNFKDALSEFPETRNAWYKFEDNKMKEFALGWLRDNDIEIAQ